MWINNACCTRHTFFSMNVVLMVPTLYSCYNFVACATKLSTSVATFYLYQRFFACTRVISWISLDHDTQTRTCHSDHRLFIYCRSFVSDCLSFVLLSGQFQWGYTEKSGCIFIIDDQLLFTGCKVRLWKRNLLLVWTSGLMLLMLFHFFVS